MVRLGQQTKQNGIQHYRGPSSYDDTSYITDTSSITNPVELGISYSHESFGDENVSYYTETEVSSALTGWTSIAEEMMSTNESVENAPKTVEESVVSKIKRNLVTDASDDGSIEASLFDGTTSIHTKSITGKDKPVFAEKKAPLQPTKAVQFSSHSNQEASRSNINSSASKDQSIKSVLKSKTPGPTIADSHHNSKSSSPTSSVTSVQKKRLPVPPLKDPTMEDDEEDEHAMWEQDCNYDINPSVLFLLLESGDWKECVAFLDGKSSENESWNFKTLIEKGINGGKKPDVDKMKARQKELRMQARTWIVRREKAGLLRWRMLPLHGALVFNAPFDVIMRLYHLYPGAVRCRNDLGMLPLHHVFMYGNEDKILELLLDVFPEALTVFDDKGRLPLSCTPKNGSDNERRSNILDLYAKFQVELATKERELVGNSDGRNFDKETALSDVPGSVGLRGTCPACSKKYLQEVKTQQSGSQCQAELLYKDTKVLIPIIPPGMMPESSLGIAPRFTMNTDLNQMPLNSIHLKNEDSWQTTTILATQKTVSIQDDDDSSTPTSIDKYASINDKENSSIHQNLREELLKLGGLEPIPENDTLEKNGTEKKNKIGLRRFFKKKL